jgi:general nucleoside transport system permease protein
MNDSLMVELAMSGIAYGTPLLIAGLGELLTERSGVLNLGVEGMMLMGALAGFWVSQLLGGPDWTALLLALLVAALAGGLIASVHAILTIGFRANQIVSGLALTIFAGATGLSSYLAEVGGVAGDSGKHVLRPIDVAGLGDLPIVGPLLFHQNALVYFSWVLTIAVSVYLYRTRIGMRLRAVGDEPRAADAMGVNVPRYRYAHTIVGGCFAGLAGAAYSLALAPSWTNGMTAGAGWIAIALVIFAFWRPVLVLAGAYAFGVVSGLGFNLQARGVDLPPELFNALPYLTTVAVLVLVSSTWAVGRFGAPRALGQPYAREES